MVYAAWSQTTPAAAAWLYPATLDAEQGPHPPTPATADRELPVAITTAQRVVDRRGCFKQDQGPSRLCNGQQHRGVSALRTRPLVHRGNGHGSCGQLTRPSRLSAQGTVVLLRLLLLLLLLFHLRFRLIIVIRAAYRARYDQPTTATRQRTWTRSINRRAL